MRHLPAIEVTIKDLFAKPKTTFIVPFFQREYDWDDEQCNELFEDLISFAFPNDRVEDFNSDGDYYFLGNIVTYLDENKADQIVDGQQRITSLLLLMRALYNELNDSLAVKLEIGKCIWHFGERSNLDFTSVKLKSLSVEDNDKGSLKRILASGTINKKTDDVYAQNYRLFQSAIRRFKEQHPSSFDLFASRLLDNVYVVKQVTESLGTALQLFLTINAKGKSLTKSDIFKAALHKHAYSQGGEPEQVRFNENWQRLTAQCEKIFTSGRDLSPTEFAFFLYIKKTQPNLSWRQFEKPYIANDFALLKAPQTLADVESLMNFFISVCDFHSLFSVSEALKRKLFILVNFRKDAVWFVLTHFFLENRREFKNIDTEKLTRYVDVTIATLIGFAAIGVRHNEISKRGCLNNIKFFIDGTSDNPNTFSESAIRHSINHYNELKMASNTRKPLLIWWTFRNEAQPLTLPKNLQVEHIFAKSLAENRILANSNSIELLGNLAFLESTLNNKAKNFGFDDKAKVYLGTGSQKVGKGTWNAELRHLAVTKTDFGESDILERNQQIADAIINLLKENNLLQSQETS